MNSSLADGSAMIVHWISHCIHWIPAPQVTTYGVMKNIGYEYKVDTTDELFQQISDATRHVNNTAVLCKVTSSLVKWIRLCIQADSRHFEQLL
jgi:hypothetical protein